MRTTRSIVDVHLLDTMLPLFLLLDLRFDTSTVAARCLRSPSLYCACMSCSTQSSALASISEGCTTKDLVVLSFTPPSLFCLQLGVRLECGKGPVLPVIRDSRLYFDAFEC
jgi:hypothetical protein